MVKNVNPIRVGFLMARVVVEVQKAFSMTENSVSGIKSSVASMVAQVMETFHSPQDVAPLLERNDLLGNDGYWYLNEFSFYEVMNTRLFDMLVNEKWAGRVEITHSLLDFSTSYLLFSAHGIFSSNRNIFAKFCTHYARVCSTQRVHSFKLAVWKHSMRMRFLVEASFALLLITLFQYSLSKFNLLLHDLIRDVKEIKQLTAREE